MTSIDEIRDRAWAALAPHLAGKAGDVGRTAADNRLFVNAVLWVLRPGGTWRVLPERFGRHGPGARRPGGTWRVLPERFGKHETVRQRALRWAQQGTWQRLFHAGRVPERE